MTIAMNSKNFEVQLRAASIKLSRATSAENAGNNCDFDPVSGFSTEAIRDFIIDLPDLGNRDQIEKSKAVLRRNGLVSAAASFDV